MRSGAIMIISALCVLLALFRDVYVLDFSAANRDNYGPFIARWHHYQTCRGPKSKNVTLFESILKTDGESYGANFNLTFLVTARFDEVKISVYNIKSGNKQTQLWSYKLDNPCQHVVMGAILASRFAAKNCVVKKGFYHAYINFTWLSNEFFGTSFFYGEFLFKVIVLSKSGNILCLTYYTVFTKKE